MQFSLPIGVPLYKFTILYLPMSFWRTFNLFLIFFLLETILWLVFFIAIPVCESKSSSSHLGAELLGSRQGNWQLYSAWLNVFSKWLYIHSLIAIYESTHAWHPQQRLVLSDFKIFAKLMGVKRPFSVLICNSLLSSETGHTFICLSTISSFLTCSLVYLTVLLSDYLLPWVGVLYIFCVLILCQAGAHLVSLIALNCNFKHV